MPELTLSTRDAVARPAELADAAQPPAVHRLECLSRPKFFWGQLLTDQDLTGLLTYTQRRFELAHLRGPWGVVRGLELYRDPREGRAGTLVVGPGYAVDCLGNDIVVCCQDELDLSRACSPQATGCADPAAPGQPAPAPPQYGSLPIAGRTRIVDVWLFHEQREAGPARPVLRTGGPSRTLEYSRVDEGHSLRCTPAEERDGLLAEGERRRKDEYERHGAKLIEEFEAAADQLAWLEQALAAEPPRQFGFLPELIQRIKRRKALPASDALRALIGQQLLEALFWLVQDRRNRLLRAAAAPAISRGVPLARVTVRTADARGAACCEILSIDERPPYRRLFGATPALSAARAIDLSQLIWLRREEAGLALAGLGLAAEFAPALQPGRDAVEALKAGYPEAPYPATVALTTVNAGPLGERVIRAHKK